MSFSDQFKLSDINGRNGFTINGINARGNLGPISNAGDINGDGIDDIILGAPGNDSFGGTGESYVIFGNKKGFSRQFNLSRLNGRNGFTIKENTGRFDAYGSSGTAVSGAGDINGDGFDDLIIGAPGAGTDYDTYAGKSYVVFGSKRSKRTLQLSRINKNNGFVIDGVNDLDRLGQSVSGAGDVNGDGLADIIVGAPSVNLAVSSLNPPGESYVVFGSRRKFNKPVSAAQLNGRNGFTIKGINKSDQAGRAVSSAGDINGDGIDDLLIGAPYARKNGESYVVFGKKRGLGRSVDLAKLNGRNGFAIRGGKDKFLGWSVSSAGDVNGDGIDDVVIGAPGEFSTGKSYVVFGKERGFRRSINVNGLNGRNGFEISGVKGTFSFSGSSGFSVSSAGDINGDGISDLLIGAPGAGSVFTETENGFSSQCCTGESYVVYGTRNGFNRRLNLKNLKSKNGFTITGGEVSDSLGQYVSAAGDINGDGADDLIVSAPSANVGRKSEAGKSYVIYGRLSEADEDTLTGSQRSNSRRLKLTDALIGSGRDSRTERSSRSEAATVSEFDPMAQISLLGSIGSKDVAFSSNDVLPGSNSQIMTSDMASLGGIEPTTLSPDQLFVM